MTKHATLAELSAHFAATTPAKTALVFGAWRLDYATYHARVLHAVGALRGDACELLGRIFVVDATLEERAEIGALLGGRGL